MQFTTLWIGLLLGIGIGGKAIAAEDCPGVPGCDTGHPAHHCGFEPLVPVSPTYAECDEGPIVLFDEAHHNRGGLDGIFWPFAKQLEADGYDVRSFPNGSLDGGVLAGARILVIAGPQPDTGPPPDEKPPLSPCESADVVAWVESGGRLLLIFDHADFDHVSDLLDLFGLELNTQVDNTNGFCDHNEFRPSDGTLKAAAPIVSGGGVPENVVTEVHTWNGHTFVKSGFDAIATQGNFEPILSFSNSSLGMQAASFTRGAGRVFLIGDLTALTSQNHVLGYGCNTIGLDQWSENKRFLLNIVRWLDGVIDRDGVPEATDNCTDVPNSSQADWDLDGFGDACDGDFNDDGVVTNVDYSMMWNPQNPPVLGCFVNVGYMGWIWGYSEFNAQWTTLGCGEYNVVEGDCNLPYSSCGAETITTHGDAGRVLNWMNAGATPGPSGYACAGVSVPCP